MRAGLSRSNAVNNSEVPCMLAKMMMPPIQFETFEKCRRRNEGTKETTRRRTGLPAAAATASPLPSHYCCAATLDLALLNFVWTRCCCYYLTMGRGITEGCVGINGEGIAYREFSCEYPLLEPLYTQFEKDYDPIHVLNWMRDNPMVPVFACVLYAVLIFGGQHLMRDRQPWNWRRTMAMWNLSLSVFSWIGMARTAPQLAHNLYHMSLRDNLCLDPRATYGSGSTGLWVQLFILSKFPELIDTFFIVIHKKPLIFLHWYHHITVLLYCWHSYVTTSPPGIFFVVMNYSVHASMYGYYFLMAMKLRPKWFNPIIITAFQISQMVVGVAVTLAGFYYYNTDSECRIEKENNTAAFVMYGSYLFLFMQFFIGRYFAPKKKQKTV